MYSDLKYAVRQLAKNPGFTFIAIATLAISLGANTAIFSFVNAVLLQPLPYPDPDKIVRVRETRPDKGESGNSTLNFLDWQKQNTVFAHLAAIAGGAATLTGHGEPVEFTGWRVSTSYFDILGLKAALGRTFVSGEDQPGKDHVIVLSDTIWRSEFGGDPKVIGRSITLNDDSYMVIGVLSKGNPLERGWAQSWRPLTFTPSNMGRNFHWLDAIARLKQGATLKQAQAQMDTISSRIARDFPESNKNWGVRIERLSDISVGDNLRQSLNILLGAVGVVLLIGCANLANLSLMRVVSREREIAIRIALGAGRWPLARQFLVESLLVSLVGGAVGLALGKLAIAVITATMPQYALPAEADVSLNGRVLLFSLLLSVLTGLIVGLFPAVQAARPNLSHSLNQGSLGAGRGTSHSRIRNSLVIAEVALAFMLLMSTGLLIRSLNKLGEVNTGFDSTNVLTFNLTIPWKRFTTDLTAMNNYKRQVVSRLQRLPGITDVAETSALPMEGWGYGMPFQIAGTKQVDMANRPYCFFKMVTASYFKALRIHLLQGRLLVAGDLRDTRPVAVINDTLAKKYFPNVNPVGKRILVQKIVPGETELGEEIPWEVVGVVADERVNGLDYKNDDSPGIYVTNEQSIQYDFCIIVRSATDTALLREAVRKAVHEINGDQVIGEMETLDAIKSESLGDNRFRCMILSGFAGISLLLSAVGIYGVISYSVTQRTREIGIRSALGASRNNILKLILGYGITLTVTGLIVGIGGSIGLARLLQALLYGVGGRDLLTIVSVSCILALVALGACFFPARRATKVDPLVALRYE